MPALPRDIVALFKPKIPQSDGLIWLEKLAGRPVIEREYEEDDDGSNADVWKVFVPEMDPQIVAMKVVRSSHVSNNVTEADPLRSSNRASMKKTWCCVDARTLDLASKSSMCGLESNLARRHEKLILLFQSTDGSSFQLVI